MLWTNRALLAIAFLLSTVSSFANAGDGKDEMIDNPAYASWANHKPGATSTVTEKTTYSNDKDPTPDEKVVTYTLLSVSPESAVVQAVVVEQALLGTVESAPTKHTYPAKLKKSYLAIAAPDLNSTQGEDTISWDGHDVKCKTLSGSFMKDGETVEFKAWMNAAVPGGVVKRTRTVKEKDNTITTTIALQSYAPGK
jgi:hypothetical protein